MIWLLVAGLVAAGAAAPLLGRRPAAVDGARARARSAHARLGAALDVQVARTAAEERARARAQERWTTAGGVLASARSRHQLLVAERVALEGLALLDGGEERG